MSNRLTFLDQPGFYAMLLPELRTIAREHGYALAIHGSMRRDMDVVLVPWVEDAKAPGAVVQAMWNAVGNIDQPLQSPTTKPHGQLAYTIMMGNYYFDIRVMPRAGGAIAPAQPVTPP